jgi:hypothetical protein
MVLKWLKRFNHACGHDISPTHPTPRNAPNQKRLPKKGAVFEYSKLKIKKSAEFTPTVIGDANLHGLDAVGFRFVDILFAHGSIALIGTIAVLKPLGPYRMPVQNAGYIAFLRITRKSQSGGGYDKENETDYSNKLFHDIPPFHSFWLSAGNLSLP